MTVPGRFVVAIAELFALAACTSTITPPTAVDDPVSVFLLGEAMHTGIVLPPLADDDEFVEFGFGDWSWFALGNDSWYHVFPTMLWPTQGTLGRRSFAATSTAELRVRVHWVELSELTVPAAKARALRTRLQTAHSARLAEAVRRPEWGWTFVPYDRSYWLPQTCADIAAEWLRELDCSVGWAPIRAGLAVAKP